MTDLFTALEELRLKAGQPSYRTIAMKTHGQASPSTVHNILHYQQTPPQWKPACQAIVRALGGDEEKLFQLWQTALLASKNPHGQSPATTTLTCPHCHQPVTVILRPAT